MKSTIFSIVNKIVTFIKTHAVISIATGAVILTTAVVTPIAIHMLSDDPINEPYTESSIPELDKKLEEQAKVEQEEELPSQAEQEAERKAQEEAERKAQEEAERKAQEEAAAAKTETEKKTETNISTQETAKEEAIEPSAPTNNTTNNNSTNNSENKNNNTNSNQVVQTANTETGISWDGKSPIIYTYPDGTTGTTPKDGATYEIEPGWIGTYDAPTPDTYVDVPNGICQYCGKKEWDGTNGTCLRFWSFDDTCPNCGILVPVNTCHTCS